MSDSAPVRSSRILKAAGRKMAGRVALALAAMTVSGSSQDFFRELGTSRSSGGIGPVVPSAYNLEDSSPSALRRVVVDEAEEDSDFNIAVGPVRLSVAAGVGVEWNDNIALSDNNRESDFIFRPIVNLDFLW